jgi:CheY-like chemotaxis protein
MSMSTSVGDPVNSELPPAAKPARILVVDDEPAVRNSMARSLAIFGYQVTCAASGEEAIRAVENAPSRFDLVISDVVMEGMSGVSLADYLRTRDERINVMLVSGYPGSHFVDHIVTTSPVELLQKPFTPTQLAERVQVSITQNRAR